MGKKAFKKRNKSDGNNSHDGNKNNDKVSSGSKMIYKFAPMNSDKSTKYATFDKIKTKIELRLQKEYENGNDVAESIHEMAKIDFNALLPKISTSKSTDPATEKQENIGFQKTYDYLVRRHIDRQAAYEDNMKSAYALIIDEYCTGAMVGSLEQLPTFKTKIRNDPIRLLKAIGILSFLRSVFSWTQALPCLLPFKMRNSL